MLIFKFPEDKKYFTDLLCIGNESIGKYSDLFDFREPSVKRREFGGLRNRFLKKFIEEKGKICELNIPEKCDINSGFQIDHLIPLSSNKLNKEIRKLKPEKGKKIITQSFGSNHEKNLLLVCKNCNANKKHRFLNKEKIQFLLKNKF